MEHIVPLYSIQINEFILFGNGNIDEIVANMPGWFLWDTEEMLSIVNWIRNYNKNPKNENVINWLNSDKIIRGQDFKMNCIPAKLFDEYSLSIQ